MGRRDEVQRLRAQVAELEVKRVRAQLDRQLTVERLARLTEYADQARAAGEQHGIDLGRQQAMSELKAFTAVAGFAAELELSSAELRRLMPPELAARIAGD